MSQTTQHDDRHHGDLVGHAYWDRQWSSVRARRYKPSNYYHRAQDRFLSRVAKPGARVLELGCANSLWMERLSARYETWGLDYSETGIDAIRARAEAAGARVKTGDLFDERNGVPRKYFDLVFSDGLLEHFEDPVAAITAFARYARPGGVIVTSVPNMSGAIGRLHRLIAPEVYALHVSYDALMLDRVHRQAGARPLMEAAYWGHLSIGVVNFDARLRRLPPVLARGLWLALLVMQQTLAWTLAVLHVPEARLLSPYLRGAYVVPE